MNLIAQHVPILVVDDNFGDINLLDEGFDESGVSADIHRAGDAKAALAYLESAAAGIEPRPKLVLLDLNMPGMHGLELLALLRSDPRWSSLAVMVLTSSARDEDIHRARELGALVFVQKPATFPGYLELVKRLRPYMARERGDDHDSL